jgi:hypothetical protein
MDGIVSLYSLVEWSVDEINKTRAVASAREGSDRLIGIIIIIIILGILGTTTRRALSSWTNPSLESTSSASPSRSRRRDVRSR